MTRSRVTGILMTRFHSDPPIHHATSYRPPWYRRREVQWKALYILGCLTLGAMAAIKAVHTPGLF